MGNYFHDNHKNKISPFLSVFSNSLDEFVEGSTVSVLSWGPSTEALGVAGICNVSDDEQPQQNSRSETHEHRSPCGEGTSIVDK